MGIEKRKWKCCSLSWQWIVGQLNCDNLTVDTLYRLYADCTDKSSINPPIKIAVLGLETAPFKTSQRVLKGHVHVLASLCTILAGIERWCSYIQYTVRRVVKGSEGSIAREF